MCIRDSDYVDHNISCSTKGEWHFSWILEGMAVQDVIILPSRETRTEIPHPLTEYGTTLRVYNPATHTWDIAYCYTGRIMRLEARKQDDMIVLTNIDEDVYKRQVQIYVAILQMSLRRPAQVIIIALVALLVTVVLSTSLTLNTLREVELNTFNVYITPPPGYTCLLYTSAHTPDILRLTTRN